LGLIIVEVMPKPEILDPQGKAVRGAFLRHGVDVFTDVRQGKRFQLSVEGPVTEAHLESARELAAPSLSNPIIEDVIAVYAAEGER